MSRISIPASNDAAPEASRVLLGKVQSMLGSTPNLFRMVANSPAALEAYLGMFGALQRGLLTPQTRERLAVAIAEVNGCSYCLSAHDYLGRNLAKLDAAELAANRRGESSDPKAAAALRFARRVALQRGHVSDADLQAVRDAGYGEAEVIEIVMQVGMNTWTNYVNEVAKTDIDFPVVAATAA